MLSYFTNSSWFTNNYITENSLQYSKWTPITKKADKIPCINCVFQLVNQNISLHLFK